MEFRIRGIRIQISFYFFAVLSLLFLFDPKGFAMAGFLSCICHEAGHLIAFALMGVPLESLSFLPFGLRIIPKLGLTLPQKEIVLLLAGPAVNLILFAVFLFTGVQLPFAAANLLIGIFNLIPIAPLDGGRALRIFLEIFFSEERVCWVCRILSGIMIGGIGIGGCVLIFQSRYNFTLLLCAGYLFFLTFCKKK